MNLPARKLSNPFAGQLASVETRSPFIPSESDGVRSSVSVTPLSSEHFIGITHHSATDVESNTLGAKMFTPKTAEDFRHSVNEAPLAKSAGDDVMNVIRANFQRERSDKVVAFKTGYTPRGANSLKNGEHPISFDGMWRAAAAYPEVARAIEKWAQRMQAPDFFEPETQKEFHAFLRAVDSRVGKGSG